MKRLQLQETHTYSLQFKKTNKKHIHTHTALLVTEDRFVLNTPREELQYQSTYVSADPGSWDLDALRSPQSFLSNSLVFGEGRLSLVIGSLLLVVVVIWKTDIETKSSDLKQQKKATLGIIGFYFKLTNFRCLPGTLSREQQHFTQHQRLLPGYQKLSSSLVSLCS